jgi:hypothetical protein
MWVVVVVVEVVVFPEVTYQKLAQQPWSTAYTLRGWYTVVEVSPVRIDVSVTIALEVAELPSEI